MLKLESIECIKETVVSINADDLPGDILNRLGGCEWMTSDDDACIGTKTVVRRYSIQMIIDFMEDIEDDTNDSVVALLDDLLEYDLVIEGVPNGIDLKVKDCDYLDIVYGE